MSLIYYSISPLISSIDLQFYVAGFLIKFLHIGSVPIPIV